jgi:hypothetical protein
MSTLSINRNSTSDGFSFTDGAFQGILAQNPLRAARQSVDGKMGECYALSLNTSHAVRAAQTSETTTPLLFNPPRV